MIGALAVLGAVALAVGALLPVVARGVRAAIVIQALGVGALGVAGAVVFAGHASVGAGFRSGIHLGIGIDALSGFFLVVIAASAVPVLAFADGYVPGVPRSRAVAALGGGFLLALVGVVCARDALGFLACWELMTILPATAVLLANPDTIVRRAIFEYLAITHIGGAGAWVTVLVLVERGGLSGPYAAALGVVGATCLWVAALIGFGCKAGLVPLHMWLPRTHPVAPAHLSALMSGVMVKVALYGFIRVAFWWDSPAPTWLGITLLAVGGVSAAAGIAAALVQRELKRLLAYSTIENVGVIALGLGASIVLARAGSATWSAIALAAALLHALNHAVMKSLLFLGAGAIERATGEHGIDHLGGLLRRMPWTGAACGIGILAIAGVPPLNGFVSEWLVMQALVHTVLLAGGGGAFAGALALAVYAGTIGLAMLCFVKLGGLVLLGRPRTAGAAAAFEVHRSMRAGVAVLAAGCVVLGAVPGLVVAPLLRMQPGAHGMSAADGLWAPGTGGLPTIGIIVVLVAVTGVLVRARGPRAAAAPVWTCGQIDEPALAWTAAGFSSSLRLSFRGVLHTERVLERDHDAGILQEVRYAQHHPNLLESRVYHPAQRVALRIAAVARRLQSGSLRAYVAYFVGLLLILLIVARLVGG